MNIRNVSIAALMMFSAVLLCLLLIVTRDGASPQAQPAPPSASTSDATTKPGAASAAAETGVSSYAVRGRVITLPTADGKQPLQIHHEAIPEFKGRSGEMTGMKEMIMPFPDIAPTVSLAAIGPGQAVEFTFEVRWNASPRTLVVKLAPLPAETRLRLGEVIEEGR